jgi:hypothetical protein
LRNSAYDRLAFGLADITLETLAQLLGELLAGDEAAKLIGKLIFENRLETRRRGNIRAGRPSPGSALLFLRQEPGDVELGRVRVRGVLENRGRLRPDRQRINGREGGVSRLMVRAPNPAGGSRRNDGIPGNTLVSVSGRGFQSGPVELVADVRDGSWH